MELYLRELCTVSLNIWSNICDVDTLVLIPGRVFHKMSLLKKPVIASVALFWTDSILLGKLAVEGWSYTTSPIPDEVIRLRRIYSYKTW